MAFDDDQSSGIPIIDLAPIQSSNPQEREDTAKKFYEAFKNIGFAYVKNHGVPEEVVNEAFEWSKKFFDLPQSEKEKAPHPPQGWQNRGYSGIGREKVSQMVFGKEEIAEERKVPDCKESFEIGRSDDKRISNIWPPDESLPGFRQFFTSFYETCYGVELKLLRAVAIGMGLDEGYFLDYHTRGSNQLRLLHYPPVEESLLEQGKIQCIGAHSDFGIMTMLFQDEVGGLEVEDIYEPGKFNPAPYVPGTIVVNIGDLLMRWTNDELKSTLHRVRTPPGVDTGDGSQKRMTRTRYSIPYFINPDGDKTIDCIPGCVGPGRPRKYEPVNCQEYISMRLNATY